VAALELTVHELVNRTLDGDETAARDLVRRFQGQIFGLCYRMLGHRHDAEDVAQETFSRALRSLDKWDQQRDFEPWLLAIAGNRCRTLLAKRTRRPRPQAELTDQVADDSPDFQAARQLAEEVELGLAELRTEYRQAFLLFHEQELSYADIAQALDCPLGTVKTWVYRARRELIAHLQRRGVVEERVPCDVQTLKRA